jgi:hypothetical protein
MERLSKRNTLMAFTPAISKEYGEVFEYASSNCYPYIIYKSILSKEQHKISYVSLKQKDLRSLFGCIPQTMRVKIEMLTRREEPTDE